jgi:hypothetical protein
MKPLLFAFVLLGSLGVIAQTNPSDPKLELSNRLMIGDISISAEFCGRELYLGKSSKLIKDIFPEECDPLKDAKPYVKMCSGISGDCMVAPLRKSDAAPKPGVDLSRCYIERYDPGYDPEQARKPVWDDSVPEARKPAWNKAGDLRIVCEKSAGK